MFRTIHALVLVAGLVGFMGHVFAQSRDDGEATHKELLQKLQGTWRIVSLEDLGKKTTEAKMKEMKFVFDGNKFYVIDSAGKKAKDFEGTEEEHTFTVDASKKPAQIKLIPKSTPQEYTAGIIAFEGDTLKICTSRLSKEFPKDFKSEGRTFTVLTVLKRENNAKGK